MTHVLKVSEWESASGWLVADVTRPAASSSDWGWIPKMLNLSITDYIHLLYSKFNVRYIKYFPGCNMLHFAFASLNDARKFKNYVNKTAREKNFLIY